MRRTSYVWSVWGRWGRLILGIVLLLSFPAGGISAAPGELPVLEPDLAPGWLSYHVDAPANLWDMSQHSLQLVSGYAHLAYGGDHLYYAYQDAGGWHTQVADGAWGVGRGAALALDASNKAHISYYDAIHGDLKYATNKSGAWSTQTVVALGDVGKYSDIAIDAWGDPAIVYYNLSTHELHYIYYDSGYGSWGPDETVAAAPDPYHPGWFSFALDTGQVPNKPHVSYYNEAVSNHGHLRYAHYNASNAWVNEVVDSCSPATDCNLGEYNSLALDPTASNRPVIAYHYYTLSGADMVMYMFYDGSNWWRDSYGPGGTISYIALGMDSAGDAHVAYQSGGLYYVRRSDPDTWTTPTLLDASSGAGTWPSLALFGVLAKVAHYDTNSRTLEYLGHAREGWLAPVTVATQGNTTGQCTSVTVDGLGRAHISYFDDTTHFVNYARYSGATSWLLNTIDATGNASCFSILGFNPATNDPAVGFIRSGNLYYRGMTGDVWGSISLIASGINITPDYRSFGMAIASNGAPHFAYRKGNDLWYTYWTGSSWSSTQLVTGSVSSFVALALGPTNWPAIAYYRSGVLYYTYYNGSWNTETIATNGLSSSGWGVALAIDSAGQATVGYLNSIGQELRLSSRQCTPGCSWTGGVLVDPQAEEFFWLALDRQGTPHLAAMGWSAAQGYTLHYITLSGGSWLVQAVDTASSTGWYPSIGLSPNGQPRISYYDLANQDLKFVLKLDPVFIPRVTR